jgi:hypothetical protein
MRAFYELVHYHEGFRINLIFLVYAGYRENKTKRKYQHFFHKDVFKTRIYKKTAYQRTTGNIFRRTLQRNITWPAVCIFSINIALNPGAVQNETLTGLPAQ